MSACRVRARPIVMTSVAMTAGMLPSALGIGLDIAFRDLCGGGDRRADHVHGAEPAVHAGGLQLHPRP